VKVLQHERQRRLLVGIGLQVIRDARLIGVDAADRSGDGF
jgi:hypothetical protein